MSNLKQLGAMYAKGKNKRIWIWLLEDKDGYKVFHVKTKTLKDFSDRLIVESEASYSIETFVLLKEMFTMFLDEPKYKNKVLLKEIGRINVADLRTYFNEKQH